MGQQCCSGDSVNRGSFDNFNLSHGNLIMEDYQNQTLQNNYTNPAYSGAKPLPEYAKKISQRPKLFHLVEDTRRRQFEKKALIQPNNFTGVELPVHYVNKFNGFYEGTWNKGRPNGVGKLYLKNGSYFQGPFQNGQISGSDGIYIYPDGSYKRGNIVNGSLEGYGQFVSRTGNFMYEGNWTKDVPNGKGVEIYPDGSRYQGNFVNGRKNDENATYRWDNGKVYVGPFKDGYMEGVGRLTMSGGKGEYYGTFSRNLKVGRGKMKTETGEYQGGFQNGQMQGVGTFKWYDGKVYQGQFDRGQLHGNGTMFYPNGQMVKGVWHRGENLQMEKVDAGRSQLKA